MNCPFIFGLCGFLKQPGQFVGHIYRDVVAARLFMHRPAQEPMMLRAGLQFWTALAIGIAGTALLYLLMFWLAPRLGLRV